MTKQPTATPQIVVDDEPQRCPYLHEQTARMPLRLPLGRIKPRELDHALANGDRRSGVFLYRTKCPICRACEPLRLEVDKFRPTRSQRRVQRRNEASIFVEVGEPVVDEERVELYNLHRRMRKLNLGDYEIDPDSYREFLVDSCCDSIEVRYWFEQRLLGIGISDRGRESMSAVYYYFDPQFSKLSPGVYNILYQLELCRAWGLRYLYLGYFIAESPHMSYKGGYRPHERLIRGQWTCFS